ncbi:MAG: flagellar hook-associated protein FlgK [Bryobacterales bacterium]|nr:flagellar hook-associated protein FlgK [Bryobacterales bacterium]
MPGFTVAIHAAAEGLRVFERSLATIQNNVTNSSTPGYVRQRQALVSGAFEPEKGLYGGISAGPRETSRDDFAERVVRDRTSAFGYQDQLAAGLAQIEPVFDATGDAGIPGALNKLFQSFSALTVTPNDPVARNAVIERADGVASAFRSTASTIITARSEASKQVATAAGNVNRIAGLIAGFNAQSLNSGDLGANPSLEASVYNAIEQLSEQLDVQAIRQGDGTFTVLTAGGTPLVIADQQTDLIVDASGATVQILDSAANNLTSQFTGGRLGSLLTVTNVVLPGLKASVDLLAETLADRVNGLLANGVDSNGQSGAALFQYNAISGAGASLARTSVTAAQIAAADPGSPGGNGNALNLAGLSSSIELGGLSFAGSYGSIAAGVGRQIAAAKENQGVQTQLLTQAKLLRQDRSGVSLDEEATKLLEYQRAYQASARMIAVLNDLTQTLIDTLR